MTTLMGSPLVGANATVEANIVSEESSGNLTSTSHSSAIALDESICSPGISPVKTQRENSMSSASYSSSYIESDYNTSIRLEHNNDVNLEDPAIQRIALQYLLEKVREIETDNKTLRDEIAILYEQNDALSNENITITNMMAARNEEVAYLKEAFHAEKDQLRFVIESIAMGYSDDKDMFVSIVGNRKEEMDDMKELFSTERHKLCHIIAENAKEMKTDVGRHREDINLLIESVAKLADQFDHEFPEAMTILEAKMETKVNEVQEMMSTKKDLERVDSKVNATNQYNRRQNLVIDGIPDHIHQDAL